MTVHMNSQPNKKRTGWFLAAAAKIRDHRPIPPKKDNTRLGGTTHDAVLSIKVPYEQLCNRGLQGYMDC